MLLDRIYSTSELDPPPLENVAVKTEAQESGRGGMALNKGHHDGGISTSRLNSNEVLEETLLTGSNSPKYEDQSTLWYLVKLPAHLHVYSLHASSQTPTPMQCVPLARKHQTPTQIDHRRGRLFAPNLGPPAARLCLTIISAAAAAARRSLCLLLSLR